MSEATQTPEFDWNADYATIREYGAAIRYQQGGMLFDRSGRFLEPYKNYQNPVQEPMALQPPAVVQGNQTRRDEVLQRAQGKLSDFQQRPDGDGVIKENAAAANAERLAE